MYSAVVVLLVALAVSLEGKYWKEERWYGNDRPYRVEQPSINRFGLYPDEKVYLNQDWPWALMEFTKFVGKCETVKTFLDMVSVPMPTKGVIANGCPIVYKGADWILRATPEQLMEAEKWFKRIFHITQCANLMGENEILYFFSNFTSSVGLSYTYDFENNFFVRAADPMFRWCDKAFENVHEEMKTFIDGLHEIMDFIETNDDEKTLRKTLIHRSKQAEKIAKAISKLADTKEVSKAESNVNQATRCVVVV